MDLRFWIDSTDKSRGGYHQEILGQESRPTLTRGEYVKSLVLLRFNLRNKPISSIHTGIACILAAILDTMIPEAFEEIHDFAGLITVCG